MVPPSGPRQAGHRGATTRVGDDLTRESVIEVALALADADGLDSVTIRRLAQHFSVTPMALYWHVRNKDELLEAMGDQVFAGLELPSAPDLAWDEHYRLLLVALLDVLRAHPGTAQLAAARVLHNDAGRELTERALSLLRGAGLSVQASADIARSSMQTMMMLVAAEPGVERGAPQAQWAELMAQKADALTRLPAEKYPNLVECATALVDCDDDTVYYQDGVALFLSGVQAQVARSKA